MPTRNMFIKRRTICSIALCASGLSRLAASTPQSSKIHLLNPSGMPILRSLATSTSRLYVLWKAAYLKSETTMCAYDLNGKQLWSYELRSGFPLQVVTESDGTVICISLNRANGTIEFIGFNYDGSVGSTRYLPLVAGIIGGFSRPDMVGYLNTQNGLVQGIGSAFSTITTRNNILPIPTIGGMTPQAGTSSVHQLNGSLVLLDHLQAKFALIGSSGNIVQSGQLNYDAFRATHNRQDNDATVRSNIVAPNGKKSVQSFLSCIAYAFGNDTDKLFIVPSPINSELLRILYFQKSLSNYTVIDIDLLHQPVSPSDKVPFCYACSSNVITVAYPSGLLLRFVL